MARQKKDYEFLSCRLEKSAYDKLEDICIETGLTKTKVVEWAISKYYKDLMESRKTNTDSLGIYSVK